MLKKITALLTAAALTMSAMPMLAAAAGSDIFVYEAFDDYATNGSPAGTVSASGIDARVVERSDSDKAIFAKAWGEKAKMTANLTASSERMILQADIMITGESTSGNLFSLTCGSKTLTLLKLDGDVLTLNDGKKICGIRYGKWTTIAARVNLNAGLTDIYVDGREYISGWYLPSVGYNAPGKAVWDIAPPDDGTSCLYMDNVKIYGGSEFLKDSAFPDKPLNNEREEFEETTVMPEQSKVIGVYDYNDAAASGTQPKSSKWDWVEADTGNKCMHFSTKALTSEDPFMDTTFPELATENKYVVEAKIRIKDIVGSSRIEFMDAKDSGRNGWRIGAYFASDGNIYMRSTGVFVGKWSKNEWVRLALCYNIPAGTVDAWMSTGGGEMKQVLKASPADDTLFPTQFRICAQVYAGSNIEFDVDDVKAYQGTKPRDVRKEDVGSNSTTARGTVMDTEERIKPLIGNAKILMPNNETMYVNGAKKSYTLAADKPFITGDGVFMIPLTMLDEITGSQSLWNNTSGEGVINGKWTIKTGSANAVSAEKTIELSKPAELINGTLYLPMRSICTDMLGKSIMWDDRGFAVISEGKFKYTDDENFYKAYEPIDQIYRYMQFDRPSGAEMIKTVKNIHPNNGHPRLMYTDSAAEHIKNLIENNQTSAEIYAKTLARADEYVTNGASAYFKSDTPDSNKQSQGGAAQNAVEILSVAYSVTEDTKYLDTIADIIDILCAYDTLGQWTSLLATGSWSAAVGLGYDITYNYLNASSAGKAKLAAWRERIYALAYPNLVSTYESGVGLRWYNILDNFGIVIGSGYMTLLLALADEEDNYDETQYLLENVMKTLEYTAPFFAPDGGWYEGLDYWMFSQEYLTLFFECLQNSCGNMYGFDTIPGIMTSGYAFLYGVTPNGKFNFHDADDPPENSVSPYYYAMQGDPVIGKAWKRMYTQSFEERPNIYHWRQLLWYDAGYDSADDITLPLDKYIRVAEYGTMRNSWETKNPTFVGIHGGFTKLPHDMLDVGEFIFEDDGIRWAMDYGNDNYNLPNYWSDEGYNIYRKRTEGENCLVINPRGDYYGQELGRGSKLKFFESKPKGAMAAYDLSDIYAADAKKVTRGYYFGDERHSLTIRDEIELSKDNSTVYWFMHTPASISISGNEAILTYAGKQLKAEVICDAENFELLDMDPKPFDFVPKVNGQAQNSGRKLAVKATDSGNFSITVKLSPIRDDYEITPASDAYIDEWTLPDGEIESALTLSSVAADGVNIENFNPKERTVNVAVPVNQTEFPQITASAPEGNVTVEYGNNLYDGAKITVTAEGKKKGVYHVKFTFDQNREINVTDELHDVTPKAGLKNANIIQHKAWFSNSIPQAANGPNNLSDRDFSTRWASDMDGGWVEYDFGEVKNISGVAYAIYEGTQRANHFDILYSEDGINYKRVYSGDSSGTNAEFERLEIPGRARFVRYTGHGSTAGTWTSVLEFGAYIVY